MSEGKCNDRVYPNVDEHGVARMLKALRHHGAMITGRNPWDVDTKRHGVKLRGKWDALTGSLHVTIVEKSFYVSCSRVWDTINGLIRRAQQP